VKIYKRGWMCISAKPNKPSQEITKEVISRLRSLRTERARIVAAKRPRPAAPCEPPRDRRIYLCGLTAK